MVARHARIVAGHRQKVPSYFFCGDEVSDRLFWITPLFSIADARAEGDIRPMPQARSVHPSYQLLRPYHGDARHGAAFSIAFHCAGLLRIGEASVSNRSPTCLVVVVLPPRPPAGTY